MSRIMECCPDCGMPYGVAPCDCGTPDEMVNRKLRDELTACQAERDALKARVSELEWEVNLDGVALDACSSDSPAFLAMKAERDKLQRRIDSGAKVFVIIEKTINKYLEIDGTKVGSDAMYKQYLLMDRAYEQITALILRDDESEG